MTRPSSHTQTTQPPAIGTEWQGQGGIYAGIVRGLNGEPDYHLILGRGHETAIRWHDALKAVRLIRDDDHEDFQLPSRKELVLLFAQVPEAFEDRSYWSSEQSEDCSGYAHYQEFGDGEHGIWRTSGTLHSRAVRRVPVCT